MKNIKRIIGAMLVVSLFLVGCSDTTNDTESEEPKEFQHTESSLGGDEDIQKTLEANKNVEQAMIQIDKTGEDDYVNVDIVMKTDKDVEEEAETFVEQIKEAYPDHIIDMLIIHDDHVILQEQFE